MIQVGHVLERAGGGGRGEKKQIEPPSMGYSVPTNVLVGMSFLIRTTHINVHRAPAHPPVGGSWRCVI